MRSGWRVLMTVLRRPSLSGHESRCSAKSLVSVCSGSSGTLTGSIQLFFDVVSSVSSSFGYFSLSPCVPKLCLLASNDPLEKNVNYLHASSLPQICLCTHMSFAPTTGHTLPANLLYSAARGSRKKNQTLKHQSVISLHPWMTLTELFRSPRGAPAGMRRSIFPPLTAQLFLKRFISEIPFLSNELSLLYL